MPRQEDAELAKIGEDLAADHLVGLGMDIVERNYRFGHAEIDIIAREGETLVFCEVKTRGNDNFGDPAYAVSSSKQSKIRHVATGYLYENELSVQSCRFDVVTIRFVAGRPVLEYYRNAF